MKEMIIDIFLVILFLTVVNAVVKGPELKQDMVNAATDKLESDIKNEEILDDHYVIYDDGKENVVAIAARKVSGVIVEVIRIIVIFIGDFFSIMIGTMLI